MSPPDIDKIAKTENKIERKIDHETPNDASKRQITKDTKGSANIGIPNDFSKNLTTNKDTENTIGAEFINDLSKIDKAENVALSFKTLTTKPYTVGVATLVFFDIETTGLAYVVGKRNVQITEFSMIAVGRHEFCKCIYPDLRDIRIVHKLTLCTKPRCSISQQAVKLTGLSDNNLQDQELFDENTAAVILGFLSHLQKPVCMLAHNGNTFDFPILKAEFEKLKIQLPSDLYIVDTLVGFRKLKSHFQNIDKSHRDIKYTKNGEISYALENLHQYFFNKPQIASHSSEGDCIALAKVCHKVRDKIIPWIEENCSTFDSVKAVW